MQRETWGIFWATAYRSWAWKQKVDRRPGMPRQRHHRLPVALLPRWAHSHNVLVALLRGVDGLPADGTRHHLPTHPRMDAYGLLRIVAVHVGAQRAGAKPPTSGRRRRIDGRACSQHKPRPTRSFHSRTDKERPATNDGSCQGKARLVTLGDERPDIMAGRLRNRRSMKLRWHFCRVTVVADVMFVL